MVTIGASINLLFLLLKAGHFAQTPKSLIVLLLSHYLKCYFLGNSNLKNHRKLKKYGYIHGSDHF